MIKINLNNEFINTVVFGIEKVKGEEIVIIDFNKIQNSVTDNFIICSANSSTQVEALANSVKDIVKKKLKEHPWSIEGTDNNQWVLIDYISVVVHIFLKKTRDYYNLESLWKNAKIIKITSIFRSN